jgi:hypothetical protein
MRLTSLEPNARGRSMASRVTGASHEVLVRVAGPVAPAGGNGPEGDRMVGAAAAGAAEGSEAEWLEEAARRFAGAAEIVVEEIQEGRVRRVDVKTYVESVGVKPAEEGLWRLKFRAAVTPTGTARPERVVKALGTVGELPLEVAGITRTEIHLG